MLRRSRNGRVLHTRRPVLTGRPMHLSTRVVAGVPSLRREEVLERFRELLEAARARGVRTLSYSIMANHLHWLCSADSPEALRDATRYVLGQLGRFLNRLFGRRGKVFVERYWSTCCRSAKQLWVTPCYVLKNAVSAGLRVRRGRLDRFSGVDDDVLGADPFARAVVGPTPEHRREVVIPMARGFVPFEPLATRLQRRLPGL